jgi:hypothetical protein
MSAEPFHPTQAASAAPGASISPMPWRRRDLVEVDGEVWQLKDGNVQGEFALVNAVGERRRLVGTRRAAELFGIEPDDVRRWIAAGRVRSLDLDGVPLVQVQLSDTGHLTLFGR